MIITIDGPAGSGKSTVARLLAQHLGIRFLDTGAMYRAVALAVTRSADAETDVDAVSQIAQKLKLEFRESAICLDGRIAPYRRRRRSREAVLTLPPGRA